MFLETGDVLQSLNMSLVLKVPEVEVANAGCCMASMLTVSAQIPIHFMAAIDLVSTATSDDRFLF